MVSRAIENAQKRVERHNFDIRKHLLEYDDVMNRQHKVIYEQRKKVLRGDDLWTDINEIMKKSSMIFYPHISLKKDITKT